MSRRIYFYALRPDLLSILSQMESSRNLSYTLCGASKYPHPDKWTCAENLPELGCADGEQHLTCRAYLVSDFSTQISAYPVHLFNGTTRYDTDQSINPDTLVFIPAGERPSGAIVAGGFSTLGLSPQAESLMRLAVRAVKKQFSRINAFWVGPEALARFRAGTRLCCAEQSPPEYDLRDPVR